MSFRLLSAIRTLSTKKSFRLFSSDPSKSLNNHLPHDKPDEAFLNPDWYRTPQESDGPRCIAPDYPDVPYTSYQSRNPHSTYTYQQEMRSFGEPVHELHDILKTDNFDIEQTYSIRYMLTSVAVAGATLFGVIQLISLFDDKEGWRRNAINREYPYLHLYHPKNMIGTEKEESQK